MSTIKKLASQTAVYGLSTIVARLINYLLVPFLTRVFDTSNYGINAEFFAYASFLNIVYTYGMETAYFRFATREPDKEKVFDTSFLSLFGTSILFSGTLMLFAQPIAGFLQYPEHPEYITWFALIFAFDTLSAIPFARLRIENRPLLYAFIKSFGILVTVIFTIFFTGICPYIMHHDTYAGLRPFIAKIYNPDIGVGYTFIATLIGSISTFLFFVPGLIRRKYAPAMELLKRMIPYALPIIVMGTAGMINETFDRYLLKVLLPLPLHERQAQIGIYSACYKLSIIMTLFIQAYKMAAEPFFFAHANKENPQLIYAQSMKYFIIICSGIFVGVMVFIDVIKYLFLGPAFYEGVHIVPVLLIANLCLGAYYNLSIWYKLTDKTRMGSIVALIGAAITLLLNYLWIPRFGYTGAAWATMICYTSMMLISYFQGQKEYPVPYPVGRMLIYVILALLLWQLSLLIKSQIPPTLLISIVTGSLMLLIYAGTAYFLERIKK